MRIALASMPFADWDRPSFALSQLSSFVRRELGSDVEVSVHTLTFEFAEYFGLDLYTEISGSMQHLLSGLGEWIFRALAFPEVEDNEDAYFSRYYAGKQHQDFRARIRRLRVGLPDLFTDVCAKHGFAQADLVGFTSMFAQNSASIAMARLIKRLNPSVVTALGGANCEAPMGTVIARNVPEVDAVFSGPALHTFPEFIRRLLTGSSRDDIVGVITRANLAVPGFGSGIGRDRDIDDFVAPDYSTYLQQFSAARAALGADADTKPILMFETSRGCWWGQRSHCTFCGLNGLGMGYRAMSPDVAMRQFDWLYSLSGQAAEFMCTDNIMPKNFPKEVFSRLAAPVGTSLFYEVKLPLSIKDLAAMAAAGVTRVQPGIEALSTDTLQLMGKGTNAFMNVQFLKNCTRLGIKPNWNLLMGFPGEPASVFERYVEVLPLMTHLQPPSGAHMIRFDRFSPYFNDPDKYGLELDPMDFYSLVYPFSEQQVAELAYFFADQSLAPYMQDAIAWLGPVNEIIDEWRERWAGDAAQRPVLTTVRADDGSLRIRDTRFGEPQEYDIDEALYALLQRLSSPTSTTGPTLSGELEAAAPDQVGFLRSKRVLFEEGGRVISLVVLHEEVADDDVERTDGGVLVELLPTRAAARG